MKKSMAAFLVFIFMFLSVPFAHAKDSSEDMAGDFKLFSVSHKEYTLSSYKGKQPVLLFFWTTWCPFCQAEIKKMAGSKAQELADAGIEVLTINIGEPKDRVMKFLINHKINLTVLLDENSSVSSAYSILGVPTFCLVDKQGKIIFEENTFPENYKKLILGK